jgi:isoleucyl-tRNA synthetase
MRWMADGSRPDIIGKCRSSRRDAAAGSPLRDGAAAEGSHRHSTSHRFQVEICGILLEPGQFNMRIKTNEGVAAQPFDQGRGVVVLDIAVTRELQAEGWARDVVRLIQNARKGAGLNLTDRISVAIQAHGPLRAAIQQHSNTILNETLAIHLDIDSELPSARLTKDETRILSWSFDGTLRLWDAATGAPIGPAMKHDAARA